MGHYRVETYSTKYPTLRAPDKFLQAANSKEAIDRAREQCGLARFESWSYRPIQYNPPMQIKNGKFTPNRN